MIPKTSSPQSHTDLHVIEIRVQEPHDLTIVTGIIGPFHNFEEANEFCKQYLEPIAHPNTTFHINDLINPDYYITICGS